MRRPCGSGAPSPRDAGLVGGVRPREVSLELLVRGAGLVEESEALANVVVLRGDGGRSEREVQLWVTEGGSRRAPAALRTSR